MIHGLRDQNHLDNKNKSTSWDSQVQTQLAPCVDYKTNPFKPMETSPAQPEFGVFFTSGGVGIVWDNVLTPQD